MHILIFSTYLLFALPRSFVEAFHPLPFLFVLYVARDQGFVRSSLHISTFLVVALPSPFLPYMICSIGMCHIRMFYLVLFAFFLFWSSVGSLCPVSLPVPLERSQPIQFATSAFFLLLPYRHFTFFSPLAI